MNNRMKLVLSDNLKVVLLNTQLFRNETNIKFGCFPFHFLPLFRETGNYYGFFASRNDRPRSTDGISGSLLLAQAV